MNGSEEAALVRRCQAGDQEAFTRLVERYQSVLFGTAYLMLRDRGLAEDAVQEALIQIWKHLPSLRCQDSLRAWLVRIVVNEVKQQYRKKRVPMVSLEQVSEMADYVEDADTPMLGDENRDRIRRALEVLPGEQREAVVLRYFSDLTIPEIAKALGQREGTVKSRLSRALGHLREILGDDQVREQGS